MDDSCNTNLVLGVGYGNAPFEQGCDRQPPIQFHLLFPPCMNVIDKEQDGDRSSAKRTDEEDDCERNGNFNGRENNNTRKKLRLTKEQSSFLEDCFKEHNTLTSKQELGEQLNLQPRQVEVWFQNRRARSKLKKTKIDRDILKKCCEDLSEENRRLQKELQELRSMKLGSSLLVELPKVAHTKCPSCEGVVPHNHKPTAAIKDSSMAYQKLL